MKTKILPLNQNLLIERDNKTTGQLVRKSGVVTPTGQVENEGLVYGTVLVAPEDQNLLIDNSRAINERKIKEGDRVWYSRFSSGLIFDDRLGKQGEFLDLVPLEDVRAVVNE